MNVLDVFGQAVWRHLVFALLHTLWQGGLVALALALVLRWLPARRQGARYLLSLSAQFGVLLAGLSTWAVLGLGYDPPRPAGAVSPGATTPATSQPRAATGADAAVRFGPAGAGAEPAGVGAGWVPGLAVGWLAGVALMLVRASASALGAHRLTRGPDADDPAVLDAVERLRRELGVARPVRVVASGACPGPAVLGLLWPTVVLPLGLMSGLPPEAIRAILAHELAHVRRHDYAVNLAQMLVESLLFFNPAVWWLGRQTRVEREACCDAEAVRLTGEPLQYSRVLADWAARARSASASAPAGVGVAVAWTGGARPSTLRERVLRVLRPGEAPRPRVSWAGLAVLLLAGPVVLYALTRGADRAVKLAARVLSPAERVERLAKAKAEFAPPEAAGGGMATLKGTVRTSDGRPLPGPVPASSISKSGGGTSGKSLLPLAEAFTAEVYPGAVWLSVQPEGFAPKVVGPFRAAPGETVEGVEVVLEPGFPSKVRVVDERGEPVSGARVSGGLSVGGSAVYSANGLAADAGGIVSIAHAAPGAYRFSVQAAGFQVPSFGDVTLKPGRTTTLELVHARPARGVVIGPDGGPVAGAKIRPFSKVRGGNQSYSYALSEPVMATTSENGSFTLDALDDYASYVIIVEAGGQGRRLFEDVRAGQEGLTWRLGPDLTIEGTLRGNLDALETDRGKPVVELTMRGRGGSTMRSPLRVKVPVDREGGGGRFKATGVLPGEAVIRAGGAVVRLDVERPDNPVSIDLTKPADRAGSRRVVIRVVTPDGAAGPAGSVVVYVSGEEVDPVGPRDLPFNGGEVTFEAPTPARVSYSCRSVVGYWFKDGGFDVPPGTGPLGVEVRGVPAGAIVGRVLGHDGTPPVGAVSLSCRAVEKPPELKDEPVNLDNARVDPEGRFFLGPLPIGGAYVVAAGLGHARGVSKPVRLDGTKAAERVELRLPRFVAAGGLVVGPDGTPVAGAPVTLRLNHPEAGTSWGPPTPTARDGRFRFDDLGPDPGAYSVSVESRVGYQPTTETALNPGGPPVEIRLERGRVVTGRVTDAETGRAIPGVVVYATRARFRAGERFVYESEGPTDGQGRFRFSNLGPGPFRLNDRDGLRWAPGVSRDVAADQPGPAEVRATLPGWSKLKPARPAG